MITPEKVLEKSKSEIFVVCEKKVKALVLETFSFVRISGGGLLPIAQAPRVVGYGSPTACASLSRRYSGD